MAKLVYASDEVKLGVDFRREDVELVSYDDLLDSINRYRDLGNPRFIHED
jgi:hypothetical protein